MKILMIGLMTAFAMNVATAAVTINGLKYELDAQNKTATLTGYEGSPTMIDVDEVEYQNESYAVTSVGAKAFIARWLTAVSLPSVTTIGEKAFMGNPSLISVLLPNATTIGEEAFEHCESLTVVLLPDVTTIGYRAFARCTSLTTVSMPNVTTIGGGAFDECPSLTTVSMPNVTTIGGSAFHNCNKVESVVLSWELLGKIASGACNPQREWALDEKVIVGPMTSQEIESGVYVFVVKCGDTMLSPTNYANACSFYRLAPKPQPQVVQEDEIAVKKTELRAAKAEAISIGNGEVTLKVNVSSNGNFTAETKNWKKAMIKDAKLNDDGTVTLTVPVSSASGFMILQSGDARVSEEP